MLGRRADGYHELESLVAFADLADTLQLCSRAATLALDISGPFAAACGPLADNLVLKALPRLRERVAGLKAGRFVLAKNIPVAAGIGGGSADAAAALRLLGARQRSCRSTTRGCRRRRSPSAPTCRSVSTRARASCAASARNSRPRSICRSLPALLVNPGVPLATRDVFARLAGKFSKASSAEVPRDAAALDRMAWRARQRSHRAGHRLRAGDRRGAERLERALPGVRLARMSGSGPTCFALFARPADAAAAGRALQAEHKDWWIQPTTLR